MFALYSVRLALWHRICENNSGGGGGLWCINKENLLNHFLFKDSGRGKGVFYVIQP